MPKSFFQKLFSKVSTAVASSEDTDIALSEIKIKFKNHKRKKFLKTANTDIKKYYTSNNLSEMIAIFENDTNMLKSNVFVPAAVKTIKIGDQIINSTNAAKQAEIKEAAENINFWDYYKELQCHKILKEIFPDEVFKDPVVSALMVDSVAKADALYKFASQKFKACGCSDIFKAKDNDIKVAIESYKKTASMLK